MTYRFFENVNSVDELKRQYKKLVFQHHPDKGGKKENMQAINAEYESLLERVRNIHETADGKTYEREEAADMPDSFREVINAIINFNCRIELCGSWLWVFNGYAYREQLKELGFFYCSGKKAWAWTDQSAAKNKHRLTLDEIRRLHGSEIIKDEEAQRRIRAAV